MLTEIRYAANLGQVVKVGEFNYSRMDSISAPHEQGAEIKPLGVKQQLSATASPRMHTESHQSGFGLQ